MSFTSGHDVAGQATSKKQPTEVAEPREGEQGAVPSPSEEGMTHNDVSRRPRKLRKLRKNKNPSQAPKLDKCEDHKDMEAEKTTEVAQETSEKEGTDKASKATRQDHEATNEGDEATMKNAIREDDKATSKDNNAAKETRLPAKPAAMRNMKPALDPVAQAAGVQDVEEEESENDDEQEPGEEMLQEDGEEEPMASDQEEEEASEEKEPAVAKKPSARGVRAKSKAKAKAKPQAKATTKNGGGRGRGAKPRGRGRGSTSQTGKTRQAATNEDEERKLRNSRKSSAYHMAKKEALSLGMTVEEASEIAKEATWFLWYMHLWGMLAVMHAYSAMSS